MRPPQCLGCFICSFPSRWWNSVSLSSSFSHRAPGRRSIPKSTSGCGCYGSSVDEMVQFPSTLVSRCLSDFPIKNGSYRRSRFDANLLFNDFFLAANKSRTTRGLIDHLVRRQFLLGAQPLLLPVYRQYFLVHHCSVRSV